MPSSKQVVIIGAGPGGLASAMLLAAAGFRVKVLERRECVGGRTSTLAGDGFPFRPGADLLPLSPRARVDLRRGGRRLRDEVELVRLDPQYHLIFGGGGDLRATPRRDAHGAGHRRALSA